MAPVIKYFKKQSKHFKSIIAVTGQHSEMLSQALNLFKIEPDYNLELMGHNQSLTSLTTKIISGIESVIKEEKPNLILVQGDTTTTFAAALSGFYEQIPIGHIEAGLRTNNIYEPFPEEINRRLSSVITSFHFCPTNESKENLIKEGIQADQIITTGNTVIDALKIISKEIENEKDYYIDFFKNTYDISFRKNVPTILVTGHRRESFGEGFEEICLALQEIALKNDNLQIIYPVHLNPNVQKPVYKILDNSKNIYLIDPQEYAPFIFLMKQSYMIITDSGGIQEEAPTFGKPVLVMRNRTERNEGIQAGVAKIVGVNKDNIVENIQTLLNDKKMYRKMSIAVNPYGDGQASKKIYEYIKTQI